jgi:hypothetical protein
MRASVANYKVRHALVCPFWMFSMSVPGRVLIYGSTAVGIVILMLMRSPFPWRSFGRPATRC